MFSINQAKLLGMSLPLETKLQATTTSTTSIVADFSGGLLDNFISKQNQVVVNQLYREIYSYDHISGPAVDLMAMMPFSDFTISGVEDSNVKRIFEESLHELKTQTLMKHLTTCYLVFGRVVGSLIFNDTRGIFTDIILHNLDNCEFLPIPLRGYDPKINIRITPDISKFLRSKDFRDKEALAELPNKLLGQLLKGGKLELDPISTLYLSRSNIPGTEGMSYYTRILPMWLIEKALIRGTIVGAWRRQRSILHVVAGDDAWDPSATQLQELATLFLSADQDPQGAVVVTKNGVSTNEVRGPEFWKVSDDWDAFANAKMRALGIEEGFLSGSSSYNALDVSMSVFIENIRSYREYITRTVFYEKIFMLLSKFHNFVKRTEAELTHRVRVNGYQKLTASKDLRFGSEFIIPEIIWAKSLKPETDSALLDLLNSANEKGIPVPLRNIAIAAGLNIDKVLSSLEEDLAIRKKIAEYQARLKKEGLGGASEESSEESGGEDYSSEETPSETEEQPSEEAPAETTDTVAASTNELVLSAEQAEKLIEMSGKSLTKNVRNLPFLV